jgi:hypothetical protein
MALSEIKSIRGWISEDDRIHREECNKIDASFIVSKLVESINEGIEPSILFVPISYFVPVSMELWTKYPKMMSIDSLNLMNHKIRLKWSSKYMPFDEVMIVDNSYGKFYLKSPYVDRLRVEIKPSEEFGKRELLIRMAFKFEILDPSKVRIIVPKNPTK